MEAILDFIYTGAVDLDQAQLQSFLSTAEALQIKGLTKADTFQDIDDKVCSVTSSYHFYSFLVFGWSVFYLFLFLLCL